jgi:hypothetical protein
MGDAFPGERAYLHDAERHIQLASVMTRGADLCLHRQIVVR